MEFSNYQENIFTEIEKQTGHIMVNAVAGSGKTFSLLESMKRTRGNSIFVAFNKSIAVELGKKVPSHVTSSTLHSFGLKSIIKNLGYTRVDNQKVSKIMQKMPATSFLKGMTGPEKSQVFRKRQMVTDLISIWKNTLIDFRVNSIVAETANHYSINYDPDVLGVARSIMEKSINNTRFIDFDDMIYLPVALNLKCATYDNVFVDECQDLNRSQIEMILKMVKKPNGRIIAVGDPKQSIYGFRGADAEAMPRIKEVLKATELPLSVCYRCPTSHIELAKEIVPWIEPAPEAIKGTVEHIAVDTFTENISKDKEPLVLCRTNAPMISYALKLIKEGYKAHVRGSDIGKYLKSIIIGFNSNNLNELNEQINKWESEQLEMLNKRWASAAVKETITDYADVMREFTKQSKDPQNVITNIDTLFSDNNDGTIFTTVHKTKGLEADTVYIIRPDLLPLVRPNQKEWEIEQEMNLKYVALTRSKNKLVFVNNNI